jgi:hypothetical protein
MLRVTSVLSGKSVLGSVWDVRLARVRVFCVPAPLVMIGMMTTCVLGQCDRSALARGLYILYDKMVSILEVIVREVLPFSDLNFAEEE